MTRTEYAKSEASSETIRKRCSLWRNELREVRSSLLTAVTKDLIDRVPANALIAKLAPIVGGKGGGKPDLAQAGGKDAEKLPQARERAQGALREMLGV